MEVLLAGLLLFLGVHSVRALAPAWRDALRDRLGEGPWKGIYSLLAGLGLGLVVWGYALARQAPEPLWMPPTAARHLAGPLTLLAFVLLAASQLRGNHIQARLQHPMLLGTQLWALAHLLANGTLADAWLFGGFLVWSLLAYGAARRRGPVVVQVLPGRTALALAVGVAAWALFAFWAHAAWIGVRPFG